MKKLITLIICILFFASCSEEKSHVEAHTSRIDFTVSDNANIGSFNVYQNDNLVGQLNSSSTNSNSDYSLELDDITSHPAELNFTVEPMYFDSTAANAAISVSLTVDDKIVATSESKIVRYREIATLSHLVE